MTNRYERGDADLEDRLRDLVTAAAEQPRPARIGFQRRLDAIDDELVAGAVVLVEALPRATRALLRDDHAVVAELRALTHGVQQRCAAVEDAGFRLLAREAPVAGDLRRLVAILRLVTSVDRAAALIRHVAESVDQVDAATLPPAVRASLEELSIRSTEVFRAGVDSWRQRDALAVREISAMDDAVDRLQDQVLASARREVTGPAGLVLLGLLGRYYERVADHGVAFAQHATFAVTGERVDVRSFAK